jgi:GT2 family glycosyltransferase
VRVSAVVLNWKDDARTARCVASLSEADRIDHLFVVDNESAGTLGPLLTSALSTSQKRWSLLEHPDNRGFAGGVNPALQASVDGGFEATLVINNDAVIDSASVTTLLDALTADSRLGLVGPRILLPSGEEESAGGYTSALRGATSHHGPAGSAPDFVTWACVLVRSEAVRAVGVLDESFFMYWEDVDYSVRLSAGGWTFAICAEATAVHEISTNKSSYPIAIKAYHTWSGLIFARKHRGKWLVGSIVWLATSAAANLLRRRPAALRALVKGIALARERAVPAYTSALRQRSF